MPSVTQSIGLDIGEGSIKMVHLKRGRDGISLLHAGSVDVDRDPQDGAKSPEAVSQALSELFQGIDTSRVDLVVATPGQSGFIRYIKLPPIVSSKLHQVIVYEAQQQVPFPLEDVVWNYQILDTETATETSIVLVAIKTDFVERLLGLVSSQGMETSLIDFRPLALYNCIAFNDALVEGQTVLLLDIGYAATDLGIVKDGRLCWVRSVHVGGCDFTKAIRKELDLGFAEAELAKKAQASVINKGEEENVDEVEGKIWKAISPVLQDLVIELQRSISYFRSQLKGGEIDRVIISGSGGRLKNIEKYLGSELGIPVERFNPLENIASEVELDVEEPEMSLGVAIGLGLRPIYECPSKINLLPQRVISQQERKRKQIYVVVSAVLAFFIVATLLSCSVQKCNIKKIKLRDLKREVSGYVGLDKKISDARKKEKGVSDNLSVVSELVERREYWPRILLEFSRVLPSDVWITELSTGVGKSNSFSVTGRTDEYKQVTNFIFCIEGSPLFEKAEFVSPPSSISEGISVVESDNDGEKTRRRGRRGSAPKETHPEENTSSVKAILEFKVKITISKQ